MNKKTIGFLGVILTLTCICAAGTITLDADNVGWYEETGYHYQTDSVVVGVDQPTTLSDTYYDFASYLVFSVPELTNAIVDVSFSLELVYYGSNDPSEMIRISGVSTPAGTLMASHTGADLRPWIYDDLKDGPELGTMEVNLGNLYPFIYLSEEKGPVFSSSLNETGIQSIKDAAGGQYAIGLSMISTQGVRKEYITSNSWSGDPAYWVAQLQITTVPEPATMLLLMAGAVFLRKAG